MIKDKLPLVKVSKGALDYNFLLHLQRLPLTQVRKIKNTKQYLSFHIIIMTSSVFQRALTITMAIPFVHTPCYRINVILLMQECLCITFCEVKTTHMEYELFYVCFLLCLKYSFIQCCFQSSFIGKYGFVTALLQYSSCSYM